MATDRPRLYIFPHAGGSTSFYVPFAKTFTIDVQRVAVQYPGTQRGRIHTTVPSITEMADNAYRMIVSAPESDSPVVFFGHSMGALVAFEVARRSEAAGRPVSALFVSSSSAPALMHEQYFRDLSDDELMRFLIDLAGIDRKALDNKDFVESMLPALRGYYDAIAGYTCAYGATVSCPIYASVATDDNLAPYESVLAWSKHTTSEFAVRVFPGDHFYFTQHLPEVVHDIESRISEQGRHA